MQDRNRAEAGQTLVLFVLLLGALVLMLTVVIDGGMFLETRRHAQNVVDAAALAGAQELPDDPTSAESIARQYATLNGYNPDDLTITFSCTSHFVQSCSPAANKYDTMIVSTKAKAPVFFGPVLDVVGQGGSCWSAGCTTTVHAGACRGLCGASGNLVDAMLVIDHTGSMAQTELQNAKDGAKELMRVFDYQIHDIGLAVTPPVHTANMCDTVENWANSDLTWLPVPLNAAYQVTPNVLNNASPLVSETNCLDLAGSGDVAGPHTDLAEPFKAAMNELIAHSRTGATKGIVFETDGAANVYGNPAAAAAAGAKGPCDYAFKMATQAKAAGIEVYTIGYGVDENCTHESAGSPWRNKPASELLRQMATDDAHFYNQPKTQDLDPVFQEIGIQLAGGSKLVQ